MNKILDRALNIIWDMLVVCSAIGIFGQVVINSIHHFLGYWCINFLLLVAMFQLIAIKFSRVEIIKTFQRR